MKLVSHLNDDGSKRAAPKRDSKEKFFHSSWYCNRLDGYITKLMKSGDSRFQRWMLEKRQGKPRDDEGGIAAFRTS